MNNFLKWYQYDFKLAVNPYICFQLQYSFMPYFLKIISVYLLATVKFFYTPLYAYLTGLTLLESIITMVSGGISSFLVFYYISHFIIVSTKYVGPVAQRVTPNPWLQKYRERKDRRSLNKKPKRKFTKRNRMIIKFKRIGVWAIILTTPIVLSIPLGAFLLRKYYARNRMAPILTILAIAIEGIILCLIAWNVPGLQP